MVTPSRGPAAFHRNRDQEMDPTKAELQVLIDALPPGEWDNPHIFTYNEEMRIVHTLVATKPGTKDLYYYESDTGEFERLPMP